MKKHALTLIAAALAITTLTACSPEAPKPPTVEEQRAEALAKSAENAKLQDLLEQQRSTALNNVQFNVASYFAANPRFDNNWKVIPHTDDQITPACPQGSGWAWANIMKVDGKEVEKKTVWCSTSSASLGCYIEADFVKLPAAKQSKACDSNLPHPLKALK